MYNPEYFSILLECVCALATEQTLILFLYRTRGANEDHANLFFARLPQYGLTCAWLMKEGSMVTDFDTKAERKDTEHDNPETSSSQFGKTNVLSLRKSKVVVTPTAISGRDSGVR